MRATTFKVPSHVETVLPGDSNLQNKSSFIRSFIPAISIAPLKVLYYSEALPTAARISEFHAEAHRQL